MHNKRMLCFYVAAVIAIAASPVFAQVEFGIYDDIGGLMLDLTPRAIISGALLVPTLVLGYVLAYSGEPYNLAIFTIHKLLPLAHLAIINYTVYQVGKLGYCGGIDVFATVAMNAFFVAAIVTGGLVSIEAPMPDFVRWIHKLSPWLAVVSSGLLYFTLSKH